MTLSVDGEFQFSAYETATTRCGGRGRSLTNRQMIGVGAGCIPCGKADVAHREESKDVISLSVRFESDVKEVSSRD